MTPIKSSVLLLNFRENATIINNTAKAPIKAATTIMLFPKNVPDSILPNINVVSPTPNDAPELMPKMEGSAKGFLKNVCMSSPEIERAMPEIMAVSAEGSLISKIIF